MQYLLAQIGGTLTVGALIAGLFMIKHKQKAANIVWGLTFILCLEPIFLEILDEQLLRHMLLAICFLGLLYTYIRNRN